MTPERLRHWETVVRERFGPHEEVAALQVSLRLKVGVGVAQDIVWGMRCAGVLVRTSPGFYRWAGEEMTRP